MINSNTSPQASAALQQRQQVLDGVQNPGGPHAARIGGQRLFGHNAREHLEARHADRHRRHTSGQTPHGGTKVTYEQSVDAAANAERNVRIEAVADHHRTLWVNCDGRTIQR